MKQRSQSLVDKDVAFRRYYNRHLEPLEQRFEALRRKAVKEHILRILFALASWLAASVLIGYLAWPIGELWFFVGFFALVTGIGLGIWAWLPAGAHRLRLQEQVLSRIVRFFGDLHYRSEPDLAPSRYHNWMVLPKFSKTHSEDQIEGNYRGVPLKLAEVRLEYEYRSSSSSDNTTSTRVAYKGLLIDFELDDEFPGVTLVRSSGSDMKGDFRLDPTLKDVGEGSGFEVFATPSAPGSKIAGTWFLDRLAKVSALFEAKQLFASFHENRLVMLIEHKGDYFEMSHRQQTDFAQDAERIQDQLGRFFSIVDLLQLRGKAEESGEQTGGLEDPEFPEIQEDNTTDPYDIGGWGCLSAFVMFAAAMAGYILLLDPTLSKGEMLWWSAFGGFLSSLGLWQALRGALNRSVGTLIFGVILLAGAFAVLYYYVPPDTQALIHSWVPVK